MDALQISLDQLHADLGVLVEKYREAHGTDRISVEADYYWQVPAASRYNPYTQPTDLTLGQLDEDATFLRAAVVDEDQASAYPLVWLAHLLEAAGVAAES